MSFLSLRGIQESGVLDRERILQNLRDYSHAVFMLTWQRQGILASIAVLTGFFFDAWMAFLFFAVNMTCEIVDLAISRLVRRLSVHDKWAIRQALAAFMANTVCSATAISGYAIWVALKEDGAGMFTALFCLFAAALYAAMNNHQIMPALVVRIIMYGASFLFITVRDLWIYRPPLSSEMWLQFFTVIFVMYFVIDSAVVFFKLYRRNLKNLAELEAEHERTKAALVVKSQFVSVVSHELRTPLTSIKGSLDLINSGRVGQVAPQIRPLVDMATKNSIRLADLIDDLLDLQKIEAGEMKFRRERVDVRRLVADAVAGNQGLAEKFAVTIAASVPEADEAPVMIEGEEPRFMQVLSNMISNAAKFSHHGGEVAVGYSAEGGRVRVFVTDHGIGIPEGSKDKVFGRFTQLDSSDQRKTGGTGLGMNISREIIEAFGGIIDYDSELGHGTTFYFELPQAAAPASEAPSKDPKIVPLRKAVNG